MECHPSKDNYAVLEEARNTLVSHVPIKWNDKPANPLPHWLDPDAIQKGRQFVTRHFFLIIFTHFLSLLLLFSYVPVRIILMRTGKSHTKKLSLARYMSTLNHVRLWYESDLSLPSSEAVKDVLKIRRIHAGVSKRMKDEGQLDTAKTKTSDSSFEPDNDTKASTLICALQDLKKDMNNNVQQSQQQLFWPEAEKGYPAPITQLDMIVTQYGFMGLLTSFPRKFGLRSHEDLEGLKGFSHIWAVVGYLLGIQDEFNLCLGEKSELKQCILKEILLKDLCSGSGDSYQLWDSLVSAMNMFVPFLSVQAEMLYVVDHIMEFKGLGLFKDAPFNDKFCYKIKIVILNLCGKSTIIRSGFNFYLRVALYIVNVWLTIMKKTVRIKTCLAKSLKD